MKQDKSKVKVSFEKWELKNLYEIIDFTEKKLTSEVPETKGVFVKHTAMLDAIQSIRPKIVKAFCKKNDK